MDLLVLDLNGVLVERVYSDENVPPDPDRPPPLLTVARTRVYLRPHARSFLSWAMERFHVAVWTSARDATAKAIVRALIGQDGRFAFVWSQERCVVERRRGKPNIRKDLGRIHEAYPGVGRVAIVDDSAEKVLGLSPTARLVTGGRRMVDLAPDAPLRAELDAFLGRRRAGDRLLEAPVGGGRRTADGRLGFDDVVAGRTLAKWGALAHEALADAHGWSPTPPRPNTFGFSNMVSSVASLLAFVSSGPALPDVDAAASAVHEGWIANYVYWRDNAPLPKRFAPPHRPLGDERRNACAASSFADLPEEEKEKDRVVARAVLAALAREAVPPVLAALARDPPVLAALARPV